MNDRGMNDSGTYKSVSRIAMNDEADIEAEIPDSFCFKHTLLAISSSGQNKDITITFTKEKIVIAEMLKDDNGKDVGAASIKIKASKIPYRYQCNTDSYSVMIPVTEFAKHLKSVPRENKVSLRVGQMYGFSMWLESQNSLTRIKHTVVEPSRIVPPKFKTLGINSYMQKIAMIDKACSGSESLLVQSANYSAKDERVSGIILSSKIQNAGNESFVVCGKGLNGHAMKSVVPDTPFSVNVPRVAVTMLKMSTKWGQDKNSPFYVCGYSDNRNGDMVKFKFLISYYGSVTVAIRNTTPSV